MSEAMARFAWDEQEEANRVSPHLRHHRGVLLWERTLRIEGREEEVKEEKARHHSRMTSATSGSYSSSNAFDGRAGADGTD